MDDIWPIVLAVAIGFMTGSLLCHSRHQSVEIRHIIRCVE